MLDYLKIDFQPKANPEAIVQSGRVRFTILTSRLIRMEYDPKEAFEDRPTQVFWYRDLPVPKFHTSIEENHIRIETEYLVLDYDIQDFGFYQHYLRIKIKDLNFTWEHGQDNKTNLKGTIRTLDNIDGAKKLDPGLISRSGWAIVDDSSSLVFNEAGWLKTRLAHPEAKDLYFFGYGRDYTACIIDFQKLSGQIPIIPRFALGNWWSRYWAYHQDELIDLVHGFQERDIPLSVCIVDMDWHIVDTGNESSGWTGYTWNNELFPEPKRFLDEIHDLGLKTGLNLHPASGVHSHEAGYKNMAKRLGVDPKTKEPLPFDIADQNFTQAYFEVLHHPLEDIGVDFWWLDWQQGTKTTVKGLDPLFWLNHLHFYDRARDGEKRPFIFSRWGGLGSQRYPIGFSGDTIVSWESLQFQPYFTATAANVGYGWWSHDIGGHMGGVEEPELYLRWVQYGVFSPILRLHATKNPFHERRPWAYDAETHAQASRALRLRHALIPYLYTAAWKNNVEGILPIRPMYHLYPEENDAYHCPNEYTFGSELIAVPFTTPTDENTRLSRQPVWLPEGDWFDFFNGDHYQGGGWHAIYGDLGRIPVFAKAGAIVPMGPDATWGGISLPDTLIINIYPGADNTYQLYEDDGESQNYKAGEFSLTTFDFSWQSDQAVFTINPVEGDTSLLSKDRIFKLIFHAWNEPGSVSIKINGKSQQADWHYDENLHQLTFTDIALSVDSSLMIKINGSGDLLFDEDQRKYKLERMLDIFKMNTTVKKSLHEQLDDFISDPFMLVKYADRMDEAHLLAFMETWIGCQIEKFSEDPQEAFQRMINQLYHH